MLKLPFAFAAFSSVLVTLATGSAVAQKIPPELPLAIVCWNGAAQTWRAGYLDTVKEDGTVIYSSLTGQLSATVNAKGVVQPPSNRLSGDCPGKTLEQLRAMGRVIEFQRTGK